MERRENLEVKEFIINYVTSKLEGCSLFSDTFGKGFAKERLRRNIRQVYTNVKSKDRKGECNNVQNTITIFSGEEDGPLLTKEEIEEDEELLETAGHEGVHAALIRTKEECEDRNLKSGTGMLERYHDGTELGRGLNEGLTNWIWEQTGEKITKYKRLVNCIKLLSLAIGKEKVMQFGKGDIRGNIANLLQMTETECVNLVGLGDSIYKVENKANRLSRIMEALYAKQRAESMQNLDNIKEELGADYGTYIALLEQNEVAKNGTIEQKIEYFDGILNGQNKILERYIAEFDELVLQKYFVQEIYEEKDASSITLSKMRRLDELNSLLGSNNEVEQDSEAYKFKKHYTELSDRVYNGTLEVAKREFKAGTLTGKRIQELEYLVNRKKQNGDGRYEANRRFIDEIAKMINPGKSGAVSKLLCELMSEGKTDEVEEYEIEALNLKNPKVYIYKKRGKVVATYDGDYVHKQNKSSNREAQFDFTLVDENMQDIIADFDRLSNRILSNDQEAEIRIINRLITVYSKNKEKHYYVKNNKIMPVKKEHRRSAKVNIAFEETNALEVQENGVLPRIQRAIRERLQKLLRGNSNAEQSNFTENSRAKQAMFKGQMSDMSNYTDTPIVQEKPGQDVENIEGRIEGEEH